MAKKLEFTALASKTIGGAIYIAKKEKSEYVTPEHFFLSVLGITEFRSVLEDLKIDTDEVKLFLHSYIKTLAVDEFEDINLSAMCQELMSKAINITMGNSLSKITLGNLVLGFLKLKETQFRYYIEDNFEDEDILYNLMTRLAHFEFGDEKDSVKTTENEFGNFSKNISGIVIEGEVPPHFVQFIESVMGFNPFQGMNEEAAKESTSSKTESNKKQKEQPKMKYLDKYAVCLNNQEFKPVIGREEEVELTCRTLQRKDKSNPIHVGEPGVGKTAIVHGLVQRIKQGNVPDALKDAMIYELSMGSLVAGTQYRGEFEERLNGVLKDAKSNPNVILYIDEIHQLVGAGATGSGSMNGAQIMKPYLQDGSIRCIGATTYKEYKQYFESDSALARRFKKIDVSEPTTAEAIQILEGLKATYEKHHNVTYSEDAISQAVMLSQKYMTERFLPDKAIDLMDEAGAYINASKLKKRIVTPKLIQKVLAESCNIPQATVETDERNRLKNLEKNLKKSVFGQDEAIDALVESVFIARAGLTNENKPMGSYLFVGATGTGKTELAKQLADNLGLHFIRYNMSEYGEKHTASKLIGAPSGYVGYEEGGLLTEDIRKHPYSVLLLDEFEKAHSDIYNLFLQVMDDATLTDNQGRVADFRNVIIIMTSNAGAVNVGKKSIGFNSTTADNEVIKKAVESTFAPEFRNRLSGTVVFNEMSDEMALLIANKQLKLLKESLAGKGIKLSVTKKVAAAIAEKVTNPQFGGREIVRIVEKEIKPMFSKPIVLGELREGSVCKLGVVKDKFTIKY